MAKRPRGAVPRQRQVAQRRVAIAHRVAQRKRNVVEPQSIVGRRDRTRARIGRRLLPARVSTRQFVDQGANGNVGISREQDIDRRQRLIIHVPAAMQRVVERCVNRRRRAIAAGSGERAPEIDPVEAQDYVGLRDDVGGLARQQHAGRGAMQWMIGRKGGADLEIGEHARAEQLCERDALVPRCFAA